MLIGVVPVWVCLRACMCPLDILVLSAGPKLVGGTAAGGKGTRHTRFGSAIEARPGTRRDVVTALPVGMDVIRGRC